METEFDFWDWLAFAVAMIAMLVGACASAITVGGTGFLWAAGTIMVLAAGSVGIRAWLKARRVVWTEELREAQRQRAKQQLWETVPFGLFWVGMLVVRRLESDGVLPPQASAIVILVLFVGWIWLWRVIRRWRVSNQAN